MVRDGGPAANGVLLKFRQVVRLDTQLRHSKRAIAIANPNPSAHACQPSHTTSYVLARKVCGRMRRDQPIQLVVLGDPFRTKQCGQDRVVVVQILFQLLNRHFSQIFDNFRIDSRTMSLDGSPISNSSSERVQTVSIAFLKKFVKVPRDPEPLEKCQESATLQTQLPQLLLVCDDLVTQGREQSRITTSELYAHGFVKRPAIPQKRVDAKKPVIMFSRPPEMKRIVNGIPVHVKRLVHIVELAK